MMFPYIHFHALLLLYHFSFSHHSLVSVPWLPQFRRDLFDRSYILSQPILSGCSLHHSPLFLFFIQHPPRRKSSGILNHQSTLLFISSLSLLSVSLFSRTTNPFFPSFHALQFARRFLSFFPIGSHRPPSSYSLLSSYQFHFNPHPKSFSFPAIESLSNNCHFFLNPQHSWPVIHSHYFYCSLSLLDFLFLSHKSIPPVHVIVAVLQL